MYLVLIAAGVGFLAFFAIVAYLTGETIRLEQRAALKGYAEKRREVLKVLRERERLEAQKRAEEERQRQEREAQRSLELPQTPTDRKLVDDLQFVMQVATEAPVVFANVIRTYVASDPVTAGHVPLQPDDLRSSKPAVGARAEAEPES